MESPKFPSNGATAYELGYRAGWTGNNPLSQPTQWFKQPWWYEYRLGWSDGNGDREAAELES